MFGSLGGLVKGLPIIGGAIDYLTDVPTVQYSPSVQGVGATAGIVPGSPEAMALQQIFAQQGSGAGGAGGNTNPPVSAEGVLSNQAKGTFLGDALRQLIGGQQQQQAGGQSLPSIMNHPAMIAARAQSQAQDFRNRQTGLADALMSRIQGGAPSPAEMQMRQGIEQAVAGQRSAAASMRGVNPALAARMAAQQGAQIMSQGNRQAAILRAQEQASAEQAMGNLVTGAREQDLGFDRFRTESDLQGQELAIERDLGIGRIEADIAQANADREAARANAMIGGTSKAASSFLPKISDERAKTDIDERAGSESIRRMLDNLSPAKYKYKDPENGEGDHFSVMAQDLEESEVGKSFVEMGDDGYRRVDYGKGLGAILAAQADLHHRMKQLENRG